MQEGGYREGGIKTPDGKNGTCTLPRTEIRQLRAKYASQLGSKTLLTTTTKMPPGTLAKVPLVEEGQALGDAPKPRGERIGYLLHVHMAGGTPVCVAAKAHEEGLPRPNWNCNGRGDDPSYNTGPGGLWNAAWPCHERVDAMRAVGATFLAVETVFRPEDVACADAFQFVVVLRHPMERLMDHISFEGQYWPEDGVTVALEWSRKDSPSNNTRRGSPVVDNYLLRTLLGADVYRYPLGELTEQDLMNGIAVLQRFVVIPYDKMKSWGPLLLKCFLDWDAPQADTSYLQEPDHSAGVQNHLRKFGQQEIQRLTQLNELDMHLYAFALARAQMLYDHCQRL